MYRIGLAIVATFYMSAAIAADAQPTKEPTSEEKAVKRAHMQEKFRQITEKKTGGTVRRQNSAKGTFVILDAQKTVAESDLQPVVATLDRWIHVQASVRKVRDGVPVTLANVRDEISAAGGTLGVALVEDDVLPSFLAAPESGWVIVNVKPLADGADSKVLASRVRKEALRAFAFVAGGIYLSQAPMLMRGVRNVSDLDSIPGERFSVDVMARMSKTSPDFGITPWHQTTYLKACEEGWAPTPTNEYQKAVWDKVHALPTNPMKIEFDPKKGR